MSRLRATEHHNLQRFDPDIGDVALVGRAPALHARGCGFESDYLRFGPLEFRSIIVCLKVGNDGTFKASE